MRGLSGRSCGVPEVKVGSVEAAGVKPTRKARDKAGEEVTGLCVALIGVTPDVARAL